MAHSLLGEDSLVASRLVCRRHHCRIFTLANLALIGSEWDTTWEHAVCSPANEDGIMDEVPLDLRRRLDGTTLDTRFSGSRVFPTGRICQLHGSVLGVSQTSLLAEKTYPDESAYLYLVAGLILPFGAAWLIGRIRASRTAPLHGTMLG